MKFTKLYDNSWLAFHDKGTYDLSKTKNGWYAKLDGCSTQVFGRTREIAVERCQHLITKLMADNAPSAFSIISKCVKNLEYQKKVKETDGLMGSAGHIQTEIDVIKSLLPIR